MNKTPLTKMTDEEVEQLYSQEAARTMNYGIDILSRELARRAQSREANRITWLARAVAAAAIIQGITAIVALFK